MPANGCAPVGNKADLPCADEKWVQNMATTINWRSSRWKSGCGTGRGEMAIVRTATPIIGLCAGEVDGLKLPSRASSCGWRPLNNNAPNLQIYRLAVRYRARSINYGDQKPYGDSVRVLF